jgi:hypothetical protein
MQNFCLNLISDRLNDMFAEKRVSTAETNNAFYYRTQIIKNIFFYDEPSLQIVFDQM